MHHTCIIQPAKEAVHTRSKTQNSTKEKKNSFRNISISLQRSFFRRQQCVHLRNGCTSILCNSQSKSRALPGGPPRPSSQGIESATVFVSPCLSPWSPSSPTRFSGASVAAWSGSQIRAVGNLKTMLAAFWDCGGMGGVYGSSRPP